MTSPRAEGHGGFACSVAKVLMGDGRAAGAGFLIGERLLVTCAHVVGDRTPPGQVTVEFPRAGMERIAGRVRQGSWRPPDSEDVAIIELDRAPSGAAPLQLGSTVDGRGRRARAYGFPDQAPPSGHYGSVIIGDVLPNGYGGLLQLSEANDVTVLFSGSPVVDEDTGLVRGIVTAIAGADPHKRGAGIAYAIPTDTVRKLCPDLAIHEEECPYQGLDAYTMDRAKWFHGRGDAIDLLLRGLSRDDTFLLLLGPSGSGKTSLIQAGLQPTLAAGALPGSHKWSLRVTRPTDLDQLRTALAETENSPTDDRILLVIDQLEELFTQTEPAAAREFLNRLTEHADGDKRGYFVLVMRDDFYPVLAARAPGLMRVLTANTINVPATLSDKQLREIVIRPAEQANLRLAPELVDRIVADACESDDSSGLPSHARSTILPLLEFALTQLWKERTDGQITFKAYHLIGGVGGSVRSWCDEAYLALPESDRKSARQLLTALVRDAEPTTGKPPTRRRRPVEELRQLAAPLSSSTGIYADGAASHDVFARVLHALTQRRIIVTGDDAAAGKPMAELIHEAIIERWPRLRHWINDDREFRDWFARAEEGHQRWIGTGKHPDYLMRGRDVDDGLEWCHHRLLPVTIAEYLQASDRARKANLRRARRLNALLAGLLVMALVAAGTAGWQTIRANNGQRVAQKQSDLATARYLLSAARERAAVQPVLAGLLVAQAYKLGATVDVRAAALELALRYPDATALIDSVTPQVGAVAISPDARTLAVGSTDAVTMWDVTLRVPRQRLTVPNTSGPGTVEAIAFASNTRLVYQSPDGTTIVRELTTGREVHLPPPSRRKPDSIPHARGLAVSGDGHYLADLFTLYLDGPTEMRVWDLSTAHRIGESIINRGPESTVTADALAFGPDNRTLAVANGGGIGLFTLPRLALARQLPSKEGRVDRLSYTIGGRLLVNTFSALSLVDTVNGQWAPVSSVGNLEAAQPNAPIFITGAGSSTVTVRDARTGWPLRSVRATFGTVRRIALSQDGRALAMVNDAGVISMADPQATPTALPFSPVQPMAVSPDDQTIATEISEGTVQLWRPGSTPLTTLPTIGSHINDLQYSVDGKMLAAAAADGAITVWNLTNHEVILKLHAHDATVPPGSSAYKPGARSVTFTKDSQLLSIGSDGQLVRYNVTTGKIVEKTNLRHRLLYTVIAEPDGSHLLLTSYTGYLFRVDIHGRGGEEVPIPRYMSTLFWTKNFELAGLTTSRSRDIILWDMRRNKEQRRLAVGEDGKTLSSAGFSKDERQIIALQDEGDQAKIIWWNLERERQDQSILINEDATAGPWLLDGDLLLVGGDELRVWNTNPSAAADRLRALAGRTITRAEWAQFLPDHPYSP